MLAWARLAAPPDEGAFGFPDRVDDMSDLAGAGEKMLVDEPIAVRQENPEVRMRVIPADDRELGKLGVHLGVDLRPGLVGERHLRKPGFRPLPADRFHDLHKRARFVAMPRSHQNSADLNRRVEDGDAAGALPVHLARSEGREAPSLRRAGKCFMRQFLACQHANIDDFFLLRTALVRHEVQHLYRITSRMVPDRSSRN